jgi:hypothetical protein
MHERGGEWSTVQLKQTDGRLWLSDVYYATRYLQDLGLAVMVRDHPEEDLPDYEIWRAAGRLADGRALNACPGPVSFYVTNQE